MNTSSPWLALVALDQPALPEADELIGAFAARFPDEPPLAIASQTDRSLTLTLGGDTSTTVNLTLVEKAIPWERLEGPCATAWYWPGAEDALRHHTDHLFVTLIDERGKPIERCTRLTRLVSAVVDATPAVGVVWGASGAVHEPAPFAELAAKSSPDDLPLHLWIDFRVYEHDPSNPRGEGFGMFTTGLEALGYPEFEVPHFAGDPQRLVGAVYNVTHYLLEKGAQLKDSEGIGLPDGSQVTARESPSEIDPGQEVIRLEFE
ncbi:hypothetical protein Mal64_38960 [Pseudobythopirellula maris]|uniref:DUF4261 domain-containing protein n=1 Tax=Pseudobythopirellula maris TaxID=2527991 RepID=A0A5C5ZG13_9BACT|nr:DUF4261 domain-containing protein [Pseudobythopirellula maris]TWT86156.1 hypothetical protein Mal64_38960 [Pseudobythopirellula maris]